MATQKAPCRARGRWCLAAGKAGLDSGAGAPENPGPSGAEAGGFNQAHLIAPGGEFPALVALDHDPTS